MLQVLVPSGVEIEGNYTLTLGGIMDANAKRLTNLATPQQTLMRLLKVM